MKQRAQQASAARERTPEGGPNTPSLASFDQLRLVHELELHRLEVEAQNASFRDAKAEFNASHRRYAELYEEAPVGHLTLDGAGTIRELNLAGAALFGRDRSYLRGQPLVSLIEAGSRDDLDAHFRDVLSTRGPSSIELGIQLPEGRVRSVELVSIPSKLPRRDEKLVFHSAMIDISERKSAEQRREELLRREQEAHLLVESTARIKENFFAVVSDELRSSLAPLQMWVNALRSGDLSNELRARALEAIDASLKTQVAAVDDLLDVGHWYQGTLRVDRQALELQPIMRAAAEALAPVAAGKGVQLLMDISAEPARITGDPARLHQIVTILLTNAIKSTQEGGQVGLSLHDYGAEVVLTVRDEGDGISSGDLSGVFEPFRSSAECPVNPISGLGLTIVDQIVRLHGGVVTAESAGMGRGSCFAVVLPRLSSTPSA
jgi:PAS domain S-box-containing protein